MDKKTTYYIVRSGTNRIQWLSPGQPLMVTADRIIDEVKQINEDEKEDTISNNEILERSDPPELWVGMSIRLYEETFGWL